MKEGNSWDGSGSSSRKFAGVSVLFRGATVVFGVCHCFVVSSSNVDCFCFLLWLCFANVGLLRTHGLFMYFERRPYICFQLLCVLT